MVAWDCTGNLHKLISMEFLEYEGKSNLSSWRRLLSLGRYGIRTILLEYLEQVFKQHMDSILIA